MKENRNKQETPSYNYMLKVECFESPNFEANTLDTVTIAKIANKDAAMLFAEAYALAIVKDYTSLPATIDELPKDWSIAVNSDKTCWIVRFKDCITNAILIERICPHCGCNPQDEPYAMDATHCPSCGEIL